jgi:hypothetical protein
MYDTETGRAVRESFKTLAHQPPSSEAVEEALFRQRICAAVDELKTMGWPIERIIVRVKELAAEAGVRLGSSPRGRETHPAIANAVLWCVDRYYEKEPRG